MNLQEFFKQYPEVAIAFSGGVDSSYLLYAAKKYAKKVAAYYVHSAFQPAFELEKVREVEKQVGINVKIIDADVLCDEKIVSNPPNRCYFCKKRIFGTIKSAAEEDGFHIILDGTNFSDDPTDRPGMKALEEYRVLSPLRTCALSKDEIRALSHEAGLVTWSDPSYSCLATRIATGEQITRDKLCATESAEGYMFSLGFSNFRVRQSQGVAKIQICRADRDRLTTHKEEITNTLKQYYSEVIFDTEFRP